MANGLFRQDIVDQAGSGPDHPAGTRQERTKVRGRGPFAREGDEMLVAAGGALDAQEPVIEPAALQVVI